MHAEVGLSRYCCVCVRVCVCVYVRVCVCGWVYVHEWLGHSVSDAHSIPTLVGIATVGQCVKVHLEVIPHIQIIKKSILWLSVTTTDHLSFSCPNRVTLWPDDTVGSV